MAENTLMRNNALSEPIYGLPFTIVFPLLDADGDPISPSSADSEISKNGDTAGDCGSEATEISGLTGVCYLDLTAAEMTCDVAAIETTSTGAKTTINVLYPRKLPVLRTGTAASGGSDTNSVVLDSGASAIDDYYNGCVVSVVIDAGAPQVRLVTDYTGSNKTCTVHADFTTAPDNSDTFTVYNSPMRVFKQSDVYGWAGTAVATVHTAGYPVVTIKDGTGTGEIDTTSGGVLVAAIASGAITATALASDCITAAKIATDAIGADELADGAITAATFAASAITSTVLANDAITAAKLAADCITAAKIATSAIDADAIAADALTSSELAQSWVDEIAAAVNTQVLDVLNTDTFAEPGQGTPASTTTLAEKIGYLYKAWRNRTTQTSTEYALYNDDGTTKAQEAAVSDNGTTFERGEVATGA